MRMSACPAAGLGVGRSLSSRTSGPPVWFICMARMLVIDAAMRLAGAGLKADRICIAVRGFLRQYGLQCNQTI